ncbi:MAG: sulfatase-like hydrolase/transferase [Thermoguttaceae bacterium]
MQCLTASYRVFVTALLTIAAPAPAWAAEPPASKPNILVILADDLGYADLGFTGSRDIPTPNIDRLAKEGVRCTSGYVSHPFCSPTRAGLLTGRYQQRFGHENNPAWLPESTVAGLPLSQTTFPQIMKTAGYVTGCVGKWHLGAHPQFHPNRRGFDEYFGLLGGGHAYIPGDRGSVEYQIPMDRNGKPEPLEEYLTTLLAREAASFITTHKDRPWFLYLAFNAPHGPLQAEASVLRRVESIADPIRRSYAGLVVGLDDAVGTVTGALEQSGQAKNTLVFFLSDNGGPVSVTHADDSPFRGAKGQVFEGGIRVPFVVSWPGRLTAGETYDRPVISLDLLPTAAALAGAAIPEKIQIDGVNILPFLTGQRSGSPHERLFWRTGGGEAFAVREGDWKLAGGRQSPTQLFNLAADPGENTDLAAAQPDVLSRLQATYQEWNLGNVAPLFESPRPAKAQPKAKTKAKARRP